MLRLNILDNFCWEKRELFGENCCRSPRGSVDWNIFWCWTSSNHITVAPLVGAWIEIPLIIPTGFSTAVAPLVGAWIEILLLHFMALVSRRRSPRGSVDWNMRLLLYWLALPCVAPLVGAWIEIINSYKQIASPTVAPLVGAWIEIEDLFPVYDTYGRSPRGSVDWNSYMWNGMFQGKSSLPSWERGLKSFSASLSRNENTVAPLVGAWIEISSTKACSSP